VHSLIVYSHPEPTSFNAAMKAVAVDTLGGPGCRVEVSDLYAEGFDPVEAPRHYCDRENAQAFAPLAEQRHAWNTATLSPEVRREIARLQRADLVILQFPLWWHAQPAVLKGWFDRVFVSGGLYSSRMRYDRGYFHGKRALLSVTSGAPAEAFGPGARGGDMDCLLWPMHYSLHYMGFTVLPPFFATGIQGHGYSYRQASDFSAHLEAQKAAWAAHLRQLDTMAPLQFPGWDDWDDEGQPKRPREPGCNHFAHCGVLPRKS